MPLHLWTVKNMKSIGSKIGYADEDMIDLIEGRMRIDVDSRRPLKFKRKVESPEGEEVTIEIKYESTSISYGARGCFCSSSVTSGAVWPSKDAYTRLPADQGRQDFNARHFVVDTYQSRSRGPIHRNDSHSGRIIRRWDEKHNKNRYGSSRYGIRPYDRKEHLSWGEKSYNKARENDKAHQSGGPSGYKRLPCAIVTLSRQPPSQENNITIRDKSVALSLTFSPQVPDNKVWNDQIIGALNDMEIMDPNADAMMDYDVQDDDFSGEDLMDVKLQKDNVKGRPSSSATVTQKG
ncbi:hypothetical protein F2Q69_00023397 [Brassica cretica]|uniref:DUF4283 domain-containing protein n=1 Tax=Brassica cretica TaxID=69181 RepID=A0A8S9QM98_BRACR|nr:hypothetical protein F2Q69_00023397 [Brassica cretica]